MSRFPSHSLRFTLLLGAIGMLPALSTDMGLPALGDLADSMQISLGDATLTMGVFLAGFALAQLLFGPLADRWGRRPALLLGCALFSAASLACSAAPALGWLLAARVLEGCGAGAGMVIVYAVVRDSFEGHVGRARLSYINTTVTLAPMIAPSLGAWVLQYAGWRMLYVLLAVLGCALALLVWHGLDETLPQPDPNALQPAQLLANYRRVLGHRISAGYIVVNALSFGCLFAYVTDSSYLMIHLLGLSARTFGLTFACTSAGILLGALTSARLSQRHVDPAWMLHGGLLGAVFCAALLTLSSAFGRPGVALWLPLLVLGTFCYGLLTSSAVHAALHPLPDIAGVAAAVLGCTRMATGALVSVLVSTFNDGHTPRAMAMGMLLCTAGALSLYMVWVRPAQLQSTHNA